MLTNLDYFKLLRSLPEDTLSSVNSQLVLLAAAGAALNKIPDSAAGSAHQDTLASSDFLKQQGLLECLAAAHFSGPLMPGLTSTTASLPSSLSSVPPLNSSLPSLSGLSEIRVATPSTSYSSSGQPTANDAISFTFSPDRNESPTRPTDLRISPTRSNPRHSPPNSFVKEEPRSPGSGSPKPSFRPITSRTSPPAAPQTSTVHWGSTANSDPPPNKTCTNTSTASLSRLHPCDTSILNLLQPFKTGNSIDNRLSKFSLKGGEITSESVPTSVANISWKGGPTPRRSYNCYWMSHVGPCNRQFLDKEDLYTHLKSHVNDLEALTPATAVLQPLNPACANCERSPSTRGVRGVHARFLPYSKCTKFARCACRR